MGVAAGAGKAAAPPFPRKSWVFLTPARRLARTSRGSIFFGVDGCCSVVEGYHPRYVRGGAKWRDELEQVLEGQTRGYYVDHT